MNITLHLPTAAITVAIGSLALFGMSASAPQGPATDRDVQAVEDISGPSPEDLFYLFYDSGSSSPTFTVPANKVLVLTGSIGGRPGYYDALVIDGAAFVYNQGGDGSTSFHSGIALQAGSTIQISSAQDCILTGYLADA